MRVMREAFARPSVSRRNPERERLDMDSQTNNDNSQQSIPDSISVVRDCLFLLIGDLLLIQLLSFQTRSGIALLFPTLLFVWIWYDITQKILADNHKRKWARRALNLWGPIGILGDLVFAFGRWAEYDSVRLFSTVTEHSAHVQAASKGNTVLVVLAGLYLFAAILLIVAMSAMNESASERWFAHSSGTKQPQPSSESKSPPEGEPLAVKVNKKDLSQQASEHPEDDSSVVSMSNSVLESPTNDEVIINSESISARENNYPDKTTAKANRRFRCLLISFFVLVLVAGILWIVFANRQGVKAGYVRSVSLPGGVVMRFRGCPAGTFMMGSPDWEAGRDSDSETRHAVTLSSGFWIGETEVTQGQWRALMNGETIYSLVQKGLMDNTQYEFEKRKQTWREYIGKETDSDPKSICGDLSWDVPVYYVTWQEACRFCAILTEQERQAGRLPNGYEYRLPTEAEWEYACRAGTTTSLPNGKEIEIFGERNAPALNSIAWYAGNSSVDFYGRGWNSDNWKEKQFPGGFAGPHQVMTRQPNNWGIYDMVGNVFEWCLDRDCPISNVPMIDPVGNDSSVRDRIVKGGGWIKPAKWCRPSSRGHVDPAYRDNWLGFRVALAPIRN